MCLGASSKQQVKLKTCKQTLHSQDGGRISHAISPAARAWTTLQSCSRAPSEGTSNPSSLRMVASTTHAMCRAACTPARLHARSRATFERPKRTQHSEHRGLHFSCNVPGCLCTGHAWYTAQQLQNAQANPALFGQGPALPLSPCHVPDCLSIGHASSTRQSHQKTSRETSTLITVERWLPLPV